MNKLRITLFLLLTGFLLEAHADVSSRVTHSVPGIGNVYSKVYSYSPHDGVNEHHPIFKFSDLVTRARLYKETFPSEDVVIKLALYKVAKDVWVGFTPKDDNSHYGWVGGSDFGGDYSEKFLWSLRKAKSAGVKVQFVYHNPDKDNPDDDGGVADYLDGTKAYMGNSTKMISGEDFKRVTWWCQKLNCERTENEYSSATQMHNKFITVNKALNLSGGIQQNIVYTTTSNIDAFHAGTKTSILDQAQSGVMVYNHPDLYNAYNSYFDIIWEHAEDANNTNSNFKSAVRARHNSADKKINYEDSAFGAFFYPLSTKTSNYEKAWDTTYNPLARMAERLKNSPMEKSIRNYVKINTYTTQTSSGDDAFAQEFNNVIKSVRADKRGSDIHIKSVVNKSGKGVQPTLDAFDGGKTGADAKTHNKAYTFTFRGSGDYYSIVGSANFKRSEFVYKANNLLMIREPQSSKVIYESFKEIFYNVYKKENKPLP